MQNVLLLFSLLSEMDQRTRTIPYTGWGYFERCLEFYQCRYLHQSTFINTHITSAMDPKKEMDQLLGFGKDINRLLNNVKKDSDGAAWHWLSPTDERTATVSVADIASSLRSKEKHLLRDIAHVCKDKARRVLLRFPNVALTEAPACPDLDSIRLALMKESFFATVHNLSGYNYSVEYSHIYRARSDRSFFPLDVFTVCQRGLLSIEPFLKKELAAEYAEFIVRASYWEYVKVRALADRVLTESFPKVLAEAGDVSFGSTRVYIGQHPTTSTLLFFVRTTCGLKSLNDSTGDERDEEASASGQFTFVTYKRYDLTQMAMEAADEIMNFSDSSETGSKATSAAGIGAESAVYLIVQPTDAEAAATMEEQEELEDVDAGSLRAADHSHGRVASSAVALSEQVFNNAATRQPSPCSELMVRVALNLVFSTYVPCSCEDITTKY